MANALEITEAYGTRFASSVMSNTKPLSTSRSSFFAPSICAATGRNRSRRTLQPFITALPRNTVVLEATVAPASTEAAESEKSR